VLKLTSGFFGPSVIGLGISDFFFRLLDFLGLLDFFGLLNFFGLLDPVELLGFLNFFFFFTLVDVDSLALDSLPSLELDVSELDSLELDSSDFWLNELSSSIMMTIGLLISTDNQN